ncbi:MAG: molybdopterin-dependent oxidoreductase, partial [Gammaproteobacteria bacterium]|nr:molybdopterin-dependent oxidoreductase [Gammaproteobacteria bacterium]
ALKSMGGAIVKAAHHVKAQLFEEAVEALDATPDRMELAAGHVRVAGDAARKVPVTALLAKAMARRGPIVGYGSTGAFNRLPSFACSAAEVEVDPDTGYVTLHRF